MDNQGRATDEAQVARQLRFSRLPERIRWDDMVEERPAVTRDSARYTYNPDEWLVRTCL
ncbi:hypothetical protein QRN89_01740 [Streptomyces chengbuensis]|uniref:hypothetical protein n=1 Tax=Streptomyces TaxID=1883 RepID=UPI0025B54672|nr:hypothetical protein [Streptomyces sp. HUAS CB01]WJY48633.1 hypothetical protein QRN89_01740 [Streptomyces sp. HUAS CB01]